jgi:hypothetical protein
MSSDRFNRQFILIDFRDLENPDYLSFVRSPEFSTYLLMRRHIWRSRQAHYMALESLYAKGHLACSLDREKIAEQLGGVSIRTVSNDLSQLEQRAVISVQHTGRQNIYLLGRWGEEEGAYYETWFIDRLHVREEENFLSDGNLVARESWEEENFLSDGKKVGSSEGKVLAPINRERNKEEKREDVEDSNSSLSQIIEDRRTIASYVDDFAREFADEAPRPSSTARAMNLYFSSGLSLDEFIAVLMSARQTTQRRTPAITKTSSKGGAISTKNKMPYFFSVVSSILGVSDQDDGAKRTQPEIADARSLSLD